MLLDKTIDLTCLEKAEGNTFFWKGFYEGEMNEAITEDTQLGVFETFSPKIPETHASVPFLFLGNIHPQLQLDVLDNMQGNPFVAVDTMNLWINITSDLLKQVISRVNLLVVNDGEARLLTGKTNVLLAADELLNMGPKIVIIKKGSHGAMLFTQNSTFSIPGSCSGCQRPHWCGRYFCRWIHGLSGK